MSERDAAEIKGLVQTSVNFRVCLGDKITIESTTEP